MQLRSDRLLDRQSGSPTADHVIVPSSNVAPDTTTQPSAPTHGPGKTVRRFIIDLAHYDSQNARFWKPPPEFESLNASTNESRSASDHAHAFMYTHGPNSDDLLDPLDLICWDCRLHVQLIFDRSSNRCFSSLSQPGHHLHFRACQEKYKFASNTEKKVVEEFIRFSCCNCNTTVVALTSPPVIPEEVLDMFQGRKTKKFPPIGAACITMAKYIGNVARNDVRLIPGHIDGPLDKKVGIDEATHTVLRHLGFNKLVVNGLEKWAPPDLELDSNLREKLRHAELEFIALGLRQKDEAEKALPYSVWKPAESIIERRLDYSPHGGHQLVHLNDIEHPSFASLGADSSMNDDWLIQCYRWQIRDDPDNAPYYLECLEVISRGKASEAISLEVVQEKSKGLWTREDLRQALKLLGLEDHSILDDNSILETLQARVKEHPETAHEYKEATRIIGLARRSNKLIEAGKPSATVVCDLDSACAMLNLGQEADDDFVLSAYMARIRDAPSEIENLQKAIKIIAQVRDSTLLTQFVHDGFQMEQKMDIATARAHLGVEGTEDDGLLIMVYNLRVSDSEGDKEILREALRTLGLHRKSSRIEYFLETSGVSGGKIEKGSNIPLGLENIGNTCYLNSLLQYYFTIKPLREAILDNETYEETDLSEDNISRKRIGGRKVTYREVHRAKRFVKELAILFRELSKSDATLVRPRESLVYLSLVSSWEEEDHWQDQGQSMENSKTEQLEGSNAHLKFSNLSDVRSLIPYRPQKEIILGPELNLTSDQLQEAPADVPKAVVDASAVPAPALPSRRASNVRYGRQQDVTECLSNVMFQIEASFKADGHDSDGEQRDIIKEYAPFHANISFLIVCSLFYGIIKQTLRTISTGHCRTKDELFSQLIMDVPNEGGDIYQGLDNNFDMGRLTVNDQECLRFITLAKAPPILQIQIQRVQFDRLRGEAYKSNAYLPLRREIYLDRYMESDKPEFINCRKKFWILRENIENLRRECHMLDRVSTLRECAISKTSQVDHVHRLKNWLKKMKTDSVLQVQDDVIGKLETLEEVVRVRNKDILSEIKRLYIQIEALFVDMRVVGYQLHSVFIHRGTASYGHYFVYIYDFRRQRWLKFNDEYVTIVSEDEVFADTTGLTANPYMLTYIRNDETDTLVELVDR